MATPATGAVRRQILPSAQVHRQRPARVRTLRHPSASGRVPSDDPSGERGQRRLGERPPNASSTGSMEQQANETPRGIGRESQLSTLKRQWATTRAHYADFARFRSWGAHPSGRGAYKSLVFSRPDLGYVRDPPVWPEASASTPDSALRMSIPNRRDRSSAQPVASDEPRPRTRAPIPAEGRPTTRSTCSARGFLRPAAAPVGAAIGLALHRAKRAPSPSARRAAQGGTTSPAEPAAQRG